MKVLNLYAGIGGNRKLWTNVEVTAVEWDSQRAEIYQTFYPNDTVLVEDAHEYLLHHYDDYDFIWSSPPCPTHSVTNHFLHYMKTSPRHYPDLKLWQEIVYLEKWCKTKWVVENVKPYYTLLPHQEAGRHAFWCNFHISHYDKRSPFNITNSRSTTRYKDSIAIELLQNWHGIDLTPYDIPRKRTLLRNAVHPELGLHIFNCAFHPKQTTLVP